MDSGPKGRINEWQDDYDSTLKFWLDGWQKRHIELH